MADEEVAKNLPDDEHLRKNVAPGSEEPPQDVQEDQFAPGQTNAGQQVAGLASASGYGKDPDPEAGPDGNHPV
ncbi:hypothetical protein [Arthrobacter sp. 8AJ]|uniref:hypothetical protein n=1 Tax=Arthrobacter sp. 8AJ TaxID=2653130 RepID=UPI00135AAA94|nr:hypothetical protein [Arthrobacter sp. 8AJ]